MPRLLLVLLSLSALSLFGCREREREPEITMQQRLLQDSARRYNLTTPDGEIALSIKRRGRMYIISDADSRLIGRASLRREEDTVLIRETGNIIGSTRGESRERIELLDVNDAVLASLITEGNTTRLTDPSGGTVWTFTEMPEGLRAERAGGSKSFSVLATTKEGVSRLAIAESDEATEVLLEFEAGSRLGPLGLALLHTHALKRPQLLALAIHHQVLLQPEQAPTSEDDEGAKDKDGS